MSLDFLPSIVITLIILLGLWRVLSRASNKRQKIILTSVLVTLGLVSTQLINFDLRFRFLLMLGGFSLVCTILTAFLIFVVVHSFDLLFIWNGLIILFLSFLLTLQMLWTVEMGERPSGRLILQSFIVSLNLGEIALALSFWPLNHIMWS